MELSKRTCAFAWFTLVIPQKSNSKWKLFEGVMLMLLLNVWNTEHWHDLSLKDM